MPDVSAADVAQQLARTFWLHAVVKEIIDITNSPLIILNLVTIFHCLVCARPGTIMPILPLSAR